MDQPREVDGSKRETGWRARLTGVASVFVILSLAALAIIPAVIVREVSDAVDENARTFEPARRQVRDLRYLYEQQVAELRGLALTGDVRFLDGYREARRAESETLDQLEPLVHRIGSDAPERFAEVRHFSALWHATNDSLAAGAFTTEEYATRLPRQFALNDSTTDAVERLAAVVDTQAVRFFRSVGEAAERQLASALALGVLALAASIVVGWFARRQTMLSAALARANAEERRLREESERRQVEIQRITESRSRLMRGFSHDVKNPLGAADGHLQLMEDGILGELTPKQLESVSRARRAIGAALHLIEDLLDLAKTETGQVEVHATTIEIDGVMRDAVEQYRAQAEAKGLDLTIDAPADLPRIESDPFRIRQVLGNLLSNAVKYTESGRITIRAREVFDGRAPGAGRWVAVDVSDTGPGIPREEQRYLFQEFARLRSGEGKRGAGIGLAMSRRIAHALNGEVTVESEPGRGSTFTLWLPIDGGAARGTPAAAD
mgnify:CR=1 FL=1